MTSESTVKAEICVSLEWAKKLNEAGWNERTHWQYWIRIRHTEYELSCNLMHYHLPAPTAEEILWRLPETILVPVIVKKRPERFTYLLKLDIKNGKFLVYFLRRKGDSSAVYFPLPRFPHQSSLANAAAAMYCYLADNNLLPS